MSFDKVEKIGNSLLQHGSMNKRVYLMKLDKQDLPQLIGKLETLAAKNNYTKIFAKVPKQAKSFFSKKKFIEEACVPKFYHGKTDAVFLAKYFDKSRAKNVRQNKIEQIIETAKAKNTSSPTGSTLLNAQFRKATPEDADSMVEIYKQVFDSYPFPIYDADYIRRTMQSHICYFCAFENDKMIAVSSAEMDKSAKNAEMTDFATLPEFRKKGLAQKLLNEMEKQTKKAGIKTFYTIARAMSAGMNITFCRCGYKYGGTLTNNTNICGSIESMNVWYKSAG